MDHTLNRACLTYIMTSRRFLLYARDALRPHHNHHDLHRQPLPFHLVLWLHRSHHSVAQQRTALGRRPALQRPADGRARDPLSARLLQGSDRPTQSLSVLNTARAKCPSLLFDYQEVEEDPTSNVLAYKLFKTKIRTHEKPGYVDTREGIRNMRWGRYAFQVSCLLKKR